MVIGEERNQQRNVIIGEEQNPMQIIHYIGNVEELGIILPAMHRSAKLNSINLNI